MSGDASTFAMNAVICVCCLVGSLGGDEGLAGKCASVACLVNAFIGLAWAVGKIRRPRKPRRMRMVEFAMVDVDTGRVVPESVSGWSEQTFTASQDTRESLAKARAECKAAAYSAHGSVVPPVVPASSSPSDTQPTQPTP